MGLLKTEPIHRRKVKNLSMPDAIEMKLPEWASLLGRKYLSKTASQFIIVGNVRDFYPLQTSTGTKYVPLREFLSKGLFGLRDFVLFFDRSSGISFSEPNGASDFIKLAKAVDTISGTQYSRALPREPLAALTLIERYIRTRIAEGKRLAVVLDYAETLAPASPGGYQSDQDRAVIVTLRRWATDPEFLAADLTIVLITENLVELSPNLLRNPYAMVLQIGLPDLKHRSEYLNHLIAPSTKPDFLALDITALAELTAGLTLVQLSGLIQEAKASAVPIGMEQLQTRKKELIEADCFGLLEFIKPSYNLSMIAGHKALKNELKIVAEMIQKGRLDVAPMGYLVCGPVGTGKSFLVNCFAGEIGVPVVRILNIRSQWQGVTEANLQKVLDLFRALGPLAVMVDEADAFLGDRDAAGDSGTSSRIFSQIASFMADTSLRGRIIWFLITCRPDLLPVDIKRQGRAEEHLPLFYPESDEDLIETFEVVCRKNSVNSPPNALELIKSSAIEGSISGADLESIAVRAKRIAAVAGHGQPDLKDMEEAFLQFVPPSYSDEILYQTYIAALECTNRRLLAPSLEIIPRRDLIEKINFLKTRI